MALIQSLHFQGAEGSWHCRRLSRPWGSRVHKPPCGPDSMSQSHQKAVLPGYDSSKGTLALSLAISNCIQRLWLQPDYPVALHLPMLAHLLQLVLIACSSWAEKPCQALTIWKHLYQSLHSWVADRLFLGCWSASQSARSQSNLVTSVQVKSPLLWWLLLPRATSILLTSLPLLLILLPSVSCS